MTAILQLPLYGLTVVTRDNEDWRSGIAFSVAGSAVGHAAPGNTGSGGVPTPSVVPGAFTGDYVITMTGPLNFQVFDPGGNLLGAGLAGIPWSNSGVTFVVYTGSTPFVAGDTLIVAVLPQPLDISGIAFEMDVRTERGDPTSYLYASTANGLLVNGGPTGVLGFAVPRSRVVGIPAGNLVADILAEGDGLTQCCIELTISHGRGVTAPRLS